MKKQEQKIFSQRRKGRKVSDPEKTRSFNYETP
jgi:hypothetical protein